MIALVKRGPDQIVHSGIDDDEFLLLGLLEIANARQQNAGVADQETARFEQNAQSELAQRRNNRGAHNPRSLKAEVVRRLARSTICRCRWRAALVNDPDPAADAEEFDAHSVPSVRARVGVTFAMASANGAPR